MNVSEMKTQMRRAAAQPALVQSDPDASRVGLPANYPDRRAWARYDYKASVVTTVCEIALDTALSQDRELNCQALDASAQGLLLRSEMQIPVGAVLDFVVHDGRTRRPYCLTGEVRWVRNARPKMHLSQDEFLAGIALYDWYETDILQWQKRYPA